MIKKIKRTVDHIRKNMPLERVDNYDSYWEKRKLQGKGGTTKRALMLDKYLHSGTLLDIGCGTGEFLEHFDRKGLDVDGIDVSKNAIQTCRDKKLNVRPLNLLIKNRELNKKYDYITALCILEHVQDPEILMRKFKGHFKKGLFIAIPNTGFILDRFRLLLGKCPLTSIHYHVREHIRFWTVKDFKYWADKLDFEIVKIMPEPSDFGILAKLYPSLFASNIIYFLKEK
ncbi:MAG: class I SAM-dependent methyltransferase [Candidatus Aenigmarchaeota archaeon]|nr:class I SAM-dependent methyltransferase [Candidatus Aenigmarchaeota archaeon]